MKSNVTPFDPDDTAAFYDDGHRLVTPCGMPTQGGAFARYQVFIKALDRRTRRQELLGDIQFQPAAIPDVGVMGWTNECLLAVVIHRLQAFQAGDFPCDHNNTALGHVEMALNHLENRTADREARQVEGKQEA